MTVVTKDKLEIVETRALDVFYDHGPLKERIGYIVGTAPVDGMDPEWAVFSFNKADAFIGLAKTPNEGVEMLVKAENS